MKRTNALVALAGLLMPFVGCSDGSFTDPEGSVVAVTPPNASMVDAADLAGSWSWRNMERIRIPSAFTPMLGILPEGPNTHATCESEGTLTINPSGGGFEGVAVKTSNQCRTRGGQVFQQPSSTLLLRDGRSHGKSVEFSFESPTVRPCPHRAVATVSAGTVVKLSGTGHCVLPGHPQSESPIVLPPPPGGTSTTVSWVAERS